MVKNQDQTPRLPSEPTPLGKRGIMDDAFPSSQEGCLLFAGGVLL
jgi:hypothetical protein